MNDSPSKLEILPNEILINLFGYFHAFDLFQSFYNLNDRFNTLIQTLKTLHATLSDNNRASDVHLISLYIRSLSTIGDVSIVLHHFQNLDRLVLQYSTSQLLKQLQECSLPHLEYLSIPDMLFGMSSIYQSIFSNTFPSLKSCHLFGFETIETILPWTQTPSLRTLKIGFIDFHAYKAILSACPNLHSLQLRMFQSYLKLSDIQEHSNLKKLEIHSEITDWRYNDQLLDMFLACVPNVERLSIFRTVSVSKIVELIPDYDWLASIIAIRLSTLQHVNFCLHLEYHFDCSQSISSQTRRELRNYFFAAHRHRYHARFVIK